MAVAQGPFLAAVLLLVSSGLHCSSLLPACPEPCTCQRAPLLNCSSSGLSSVPQSIRDSVTELDLSHNLLDSVTLDRPHDNLRNVWLGNNSLTRLSLCIERNLEPHYVKGRRFHGLRPRSRRGCVSWAPTLQLLSVEKNQLEQLPEGLEGSESLQVLQLSFNRISTLRPGDLSHLRQLKELHLQHNGITSLHPQMFQDLAQLRVLDLSFNMLTSLHPLTYLSLRNIGADVRLDGNRWQCDCSMRSLRRRMAYDSIRGLQTWSVVCVSPAVLSGRDLLQLEEDDLNCLSAENRPELHQDVTVYSGSEILLSCSTQDSMWWTPSGQVSVSQPQAGLLINDITERDMGLYVCVSEEHEDVSVFNLQISKIGGARRKTRSLSRTNQQIFPQGTSNRMVQERNQGTTGSNLTLAVCLSVFITFLVAFILGVLARPCIDVIWRRITRKKRSPATNSVSSVQQTEYDNEAYFGVEEQEQGGHRRERRVTFGTIDRENSNVKYYDTVVISGGQQSISDTVIECEAAQTERNTRRAGDSGSDNSLQQSSSEETQREGRDLSTATGRTQHIEFEHIPDPVELKKRRSMSSSSDSSLSDKVCNEDQISKRGNTAPKTPQLTENSVQQRADFLTATKVKVPQISIEGSEIPGFSSEPFADWSPHTKTPNLTDPDLWQENGEEFEFSDSARSTSARSSSVWGSFKDSKVTVAPTLDKQERDDVSSSSSDISEDEPTSYTVNSDHEEEDIERNHKKPEVTVADLRQDAVVQQQIHGDQGDYRYERHAMRPKHSFSSQSSDSDEEDHTVKQATAKGDKLSSATVPGEYDTRKKVEPMPRTKWRVASLAVTALGKSLDTKAPPAAYSSSSSSESEVEITDLKMEQPIKRQLDIGAPSIPTDSSSSSESADETMDKKQKQGETHTARLQFQESVGHDSDKQWPALDLGHIPRPARRLDIKASSPASEPFSSSDSEDEITHSTVKHRPGKVGVAGLPFQESQRVSPNSETQWPAIDLKHIPSISRRLDIKAPSPPHDSSSSSDSEDETTGHKQKPRPSKVDLGRLPFQESERKSHDPDPRWPAIDLENTTSIKRRLDIKAPSPVSDSSSSSDSDDETTDHIKKQEQRETYMARPPIKVSQTVSHDPQTQWPVIDLGHITHVKRRLDIKAPSPASDSSSSSDSDDETTDHIKKQEQRETYMARPPIKVSQTVSHDPQTQWPVIDLGHITHVKRRLDIKAPSPASDSSSSSDSEDETTGHKQKPRPSKVDLGRLPFQESERKSHDPDTRWPAIDLENTTSIKKRLDIKAPSPVSDSSSSSDSEDETTGHKQKPRPSKVDLGRLPFQESERKSHDPDTRWPAIDLENTTSIKKRLDIKAPSPVSDSSSSSDSDDITTGHIRKQEQGDTYMARPPINVSQTVSHDPQTQWPVLDLAYTTSIKRHIDIKAPSPASDSSSSGDSEDEISHIQKPRPGKVDIVGLPFQESERKSRDPGTRWPALDLEHTTSIKRRLDIKAPSPASDSSSSSDSDDETTDHIKKQEQGDTYMARPPINVSQTVSHDPQTQWPVLDLAHTTSIKRHIDIKAPSPASDSSSSSDSDDETTHHIKKERPGKGDIAGLPFQESERKSHDPDTRWPAIDLEHTTSIKRRLDIKAPSPASDSSSSSDSDDETTGHTKKERPELMGIAGLHFQESQTVHRDPETQWPAVDLGNITRIKRRLDIKAPSPPPDSLLSGGSMIHTVERKREEAIKISPSSSSSDEQEEGKKDLGKPPTTVEPDLDSRWHQMGLSIAPPVKRRLDIRARSPPPESSSSSNESEGGAADLPVKVERDRTDVGITSYQLGAPDLNMSIPLVKRSLNVKAPFQQVDSYSSDSDNKSRVSSHTVKHERAKGDTRITNEQQTNLHKLSLGVPHINRRLDIKAPSPQPDATLNVSRGSLQTESNSSSSDSEDENRDHAQPGLGVSAISKATEKKFIWSPKTPSIHTSHSPKTDHNIKLEKYTVITDTVGDKRSDNIDTTPQINPELESRWATMSLGISRFRKRIEITSRAHESPKLPSSPPPDSSSSSSSENGTGSKRRKRRGVRMQGIIQTESSLPPENKPLNVSLSLKGQGDNSGNSVEVKERLRKDYGIPKTEGKSVEKKASSSSESENEMMDHTVPDLSRGVPRVPRRLNVKAPLPESSSSSSSSSENESEVRGYTAKQSRYASDVSEITDIDPVITYKRTIFKTFAHSSPTIDHTNQTQPHTGAEMVTVAQEGPSHSVGGRNASLATRTFPNISFDDAVKRRIEQHGHTTDVDLPPEIRWTGVGRQLSDLSISSPRRHMDVGLSTPQQVPPAELELPRLDSSNYSSSSSDDKIKPYRGKADGRLMHKYSSQSANSALDEFVNPLSSTNEISWPVPEDRRERKGLNALKAMSSERQRWDTQAGNLDKGVSPLFDGHGPQDFKYQSSEDFQPLVKQPLTRLHLSSTSVDERRAADLLHGIPSYRRHDVGIEPLQEGTMTAENLIYFDSSNPNISHV